MTKAKTALNNAVSVPRTLEAFGVKKRERDDTSVATEKVQTPKGSNITSGATTTIHINEVRKIVDPKKICDEAYADLQRRATLDQLSVTEKTLLRDYQRYLYQFKIESKGSTAIPPHRYLYWKENVYGKQHTVEQESTKKDQS
eukprot:PhF_6_TR8901/c0_g1_i1/m.14065